MSWRHQAACVGQWQLYDRCVRESPTGCVDPIDLAEAKAICARCPVAAECLAEAMTNGELGVWAGTTPNQRTRHGGAKHKARSLTGYVKAS